MSSLQLDLSVDTLNGIRDGHYSLLLGAGASWGARSRNGQELPIGSEFAEELISGLSLNVKQGTPLSYVWDAAVRKLGSEEAVRENYCVPRFLNCQPAQYHCKIPTFAWKRIYTFNIDDVIPRAYELAQFPLQHPAAIHFDADYLEADQLTDECQVVCLHGSELFPDRPIVFGPPAYAAAVTRQHTWWHVFASSFVCESYIVLGASLQEPDFEAYLAWKRRPQMPLAAQSLFVSPTIDDAVRAICERLGLIPIEMSGEEFLTQLDLLVKKRQMISMMRAQSVHGLSLLDKVKATQSLATIARHFVVVNDVDNLPLSHRPPERFYEGYSPSWDDFQELRDVQLASSRTITEKARQFLAATSAKSIHIHCIEGTAGEGKTTLLMRAATGLAEKKIDTLFFLGQNRLPVAVLLEIAKSLPEASGYALVIDDVDTHAIQVRQFIENYPSGAGRCFLLCAVRSGRKSAVEQNLYGIANLEFDKVPVLTLPEASDLAIKLRAHSKLGRYAGLTEVQLATMFTSTGASGWAGQILTILLQVVPGETLHERLQSEWSSLANGDTKALYGAICIAAACGTPVRLGAAYRAISDTTEKRTVISELESGTLRGLVEVYQYEFVRPRHRVIGEQMLQHCMTLDEIFNISRQLTLALAPYVNRQTIMARTPETRLARSLMDSDGCLVPALKDRALEWFAQLESEWGWNSRYWEQRALAALKAWQFSRARDFSEQAVGIEDHPMPLTTCALIKLASVEHDDQLKRSDCEDLFENAVRLLDEAIRKSTRRHFISFHSYHVLFVHAVRVARKLYGVLPASLRDILEMHGASAERLFERDPHIISDVIALKRDEYLVWR